MLLRILELIKPKKAEKTESKEFTLSVTNIKCIGDRYSYTFNAKDKGDAFKQLVQFFHGYPGIKQRCVNQDHYEVSNRSKDRLYTDGMPEWYGRILSGEGTKSDYKKLQEYCKENNIEYRDF